MFDWVTILELFDEWQDLNVGFVWTVLVCIEEGRFDCEKGWGENGAAKGTSAPGAEGCA